MNATPTHSNPAKSMSRRNMISPTSEERAEDLYPGAARATRLGTAGPSDSGADRRARDAVEAGHAADVAAVLGERLGGRQVLEQPPSSLLEEGVEPSGVEPEHERLAGGSHRVDPRLGVREVHGAVEQSAVDVRERKLASGA